MIPSAVMFGLKHLHLWYEDYFTGGRGSRVIAKKLLNRKHFWFRRENQNLTNLECKRHIIRQRKPLFTMKKQFESCGEFCRTLQKSILGINGMGIIARERALLLLKTVIRSLFGRLMLFAIQTLVLAAK